jgi:hypothetical protein
MEEISFGCLGLGSLWGSYWRLARIGNALLGQHRMGMRVDTLPRRVAAGIPGVRLRQVPVAPRPERAAVAHT